MDSKKLESKKIEEIALAKVTTLKTKTALKAGTIAVKAPPSHRCW